MSDYFTASAVPATSAQGSSAVVRAEYAAVEAGFNKVAGYTGNGGKVVMINPGGTAQVATTPTGTGTPVLATSPTLVTPLLGTPTSGVLTNCTGLPVSTGISGLAAGIAAFLAVASSANLLAAMTDETGTGANVFATSPTLVTPLLGTPTSGVLSNCTGLPISTGVSGLGTGVSTALAVNVGSAGAFVTFNGAGGTPSSMVGTNITGTAAGLSIGGNAATATSATSATTAVTVTQAAQPAITSVGTLTSLTISGGSLTVDSIGSGAANVTYVSGIKMSGFPIIPQRSTPTYGASVSINATLGNEFEITATNGTAFTINSPSNSTDGQRIAITIKNTSGGALGAITWGANYKMAAFTSPANGNNRTVEFRSDGTVWHEINHTTLDVPN